MKQRWSAARMPAQAGRRVIVTGGAGGVGFQVARAFAEKGADVLIAARDAAKAEAAIAAIGRDVPSASVSFRRLDLADLSSVERFANDTLATGRAVDVLVNCAGVMAIPRRTLTVDGFELQVGTNHLGHFALTLRLLPALRVPGEARVITVSSQTARGASVDDLLSERSYSPMKAYGTSKLANILFAVELAHRVGGEGIRSVAVHPGTAGTGITRQWGPVIVRVGGAFQRIIGQPLSRVADPVLFAATTDELTPTSYIGPTGLGQLRGPVGFVDLPPEALDAGLRERLWAESERLTGVSVEA